MLALYGTVAEPLDERRARAARGADYVTFTSASTVRFFLDGAPGALDGPRIVSIGPATSAALREAGLEPDVEADPHTPDGLVALLAAPRPASGPVIPVGGARRGRPRLHLRATTSTNDRARALAIAGAPHGALVTAGEQSAGRGRQGRTWVAPPGRALLLSLLLRSYDPLLPLRGGLAVADLAGDAARVKWPNDVLVDGGKLAGVLVEARPQSGWAVLGIGVNVAVELASLPSDLRASTLGRPPEALEETLDELLACLERRLAEPAADCWPRCAPVTRCSAGGFAGTAARGSEQGSTTPVPCSSAWPTVACGHSRPARSTSASRATAASGSTSASKLPRRLSCLGVSVNLGV